MLLMARIPAAVRRRTIQSGDGATRAPLMTVLVKRAHRSPSTSSTVAWRVGAPDVGAISELGTETLTPRRAAT